MRILLPTLETKRLLLRPLKMTDGPSIYRYAKDERVGPSAGWKPHRNIEETMKFIQYSIKKRDYGQPGIYAIVLKKTETVVGTIEVHSFHEHKGEIGFVLSPDYWNQGIITEAAKAVIIYAFEVLKLDRLQYGYFLFNNASKRVCEKLGFQFEGILRKKFKLWNGDVIDEAISSITRDDYENKKIPWIQGFNVDYTIK